MKQLKYFTTDHSMVDKVQCAVRDSGLPLASVKVFERNNCDHRYDGLVLQGTRSQSRNAVCLARDIWRGGDLRKFTEFCPVYPAGHLRLCLGQRPGTLKSRQSWRARGETYRLFHCCHGRSRRAIAFVARTVPLFHINHAIERPLAGHY